MEEKIILWLQSLSNVFFDEFFQGISFLASWIGAICVFLVIFFFIEKKFGLIFGFGYITSVSINYILKLIFHRARPYVANPQIVNKLSTVGYSFPSGHSVSVIFLVLTILYLISYFHKKGRFKSYSKTLTRILTYFISILFVILTMLSRMYLGQHYISDIIVGLLIGTICFIITVKIHKHIQKNS